MDRQKIIDACAKINEAVALLLEAVEQEQDTLLAMAQEEPERRVPGLPK